MESAQGSLTDDQLIERLRHQASIWFKNDDIVLLEDFIRRFNKCRRSISSTPAPSPESSS